MVSVGTMRRVPRVQRREGEEENQSTLLCFEWFLHEAREKGGGRCSRCLRWYPVYAGVLPPVLMLLSTSWRLMLEPRLGDWGEMQPFVTLFSIVLRCSRYRRSIREQYNTVRYGTIGTAVYF